MTILFKLATRSRPAKFLDTVRNIVEMCESDAYTILVTADSDDYTMNNAAIVDWMDRHHSILYRFGNAQSKIEAINMHVDWINAWDILVNVSDDQVFIKKGFDIDIRDAMAFHFPDLDGFLHFPDQVAGDQLCTLSIMGRTYYNRTHYIYHPSYKSLWCDNEATEVAKLLNRYAFINQPIFEHRHFSWGHGDKDALLIRNEKYWRVDRANYIKRKRKNFDLCLTPKTEKT